MSRLTRDGTVETVSRDQTLRRERGQGNIHFPCSADHEQDWQPYPVDPYPCLYVMTIHTLNTLYIASHYATRRVCSRNDLLWPDAPVSAPCPEGFEPPLAPPRCRSRWSSAGPCGWTEWTRAPWQSVRRTHSEASPHTGAAEEAAAAGEGVRQEIGDTPRQQNYYWYYKYKYM